jgi:hypothetical protein
MQNVQRVVERGQAGCPVEDLIHPIAEIGSLDISHLL